MLVVTRREGEEVIIGDPANPIGIVRIASIKGDRVRVAFDFPRDVPVHRREVAENIRQEMGTTCAQPVATCCPRTQPTTDRAPSSGLDRRPTAHSPIATDSQPSGSRANVENAKPRR